MKALTILNTILVIAFVAIVVTAAVAPDWLLHAISTALQQKWLLDVIGGSVAMAAPPAPIKVSPTWRLVPRAAPVAEPPVRHRPTAPPYVPSYDPPVLDEEDWWQAPPRSLTDAPDHYEVPTGYATGTHPHRPRPRPAQVSPPSIGWAGWVVFAGFMFMVANVFGYVLTAGRSSHPLVSVEPSTQPGGYCPKVGGRR